MQTTTTILRAKITSGEIIIIMLNNNNDDNNNVDVLGGWSKNMEDSLKKLLGSKMCGCSEKGAEMCNFQHP